MKSSDEIILTTARHWLTQEDEILLVTVANTWGSSPRPVGSMMLIKLDGEFVGSVSGGCVEDDLISKYLAGDFAKKKVSMISYGVGQLDAQKFGLPCGGKLDLVLERLDSFTSLEPISSALQENLPITRHLNARTGIISYSKSNWQERSNYEGELLHKVFGPQWQILLIGANELAKFVAELALMLDYRVRICDPRENVNSSWINENTPFTTNMPDNVVATLKPVEQSIVLALTHDPKMDDMALMQALQMNLYYVGAIGSHKTQAARRKRLKQLDLSESQIVKLHGPIGLPIGSKAPAEIAISILAELTALRHRCDVVITNNQYKLLESA